MKTKDYLNKYQLETPTGVSKLNHNDFVADLTIDFMTLLEVGNSTKNIKGFENAVRAIRMKWDAVNSKTVGQLPDKLWNYFYAKVIMGYKEDLFPTEMAKRKQEAEDRKRRREWHNRMDEYAYNPFFGFGFNNLFASFLASLFKPIIPEDSYRILGIHHPATIDEVKEAYRIKALECHPDKGGSNDMFIAITEAKNKCLMYLKNNI